MTLHDTRFPGESDPYRLRAMSFSGRSSICGYVVAWAGMGALVLPSRPLAGGSGATCSRGIEQVDGLRERR